MRRTIFASLTLALIFTVCAPARAYDKGGIAFILDHGKELNLTDVQKRELNTMRSLEMRTRTKIFADPEVRPLLAKALATRLKKDESASAEAFGALIQKVIEKSAPVAKDMMEQLGKLLTPEQLAKIEELKEKEEGKQKPGVPTNSGSTANRNDQNKPKVGTPPPNPFEF
jgi:Spy/CpxP family protein refolding chaperone